MFNLIVTLEHTTILHNWYIGVGVALAVEHVSYNPKY